MATNLLDDMRENRVLYIIWCAMVNPNNPPNAEIKFGFPNEYMMHSGAYYAKWPGQLEVAISPKRDFIVWRHDYYPTNNPPLNAKRINCDGLLHALALIHHVLQENNIPFEVTEEESQ